MNKSSIEDIMYGRKRSFFIGAVLGLLAFLYGLVVFLRKTLFRTGILRPKRLAQRVISVGNITLGGTGKTPAVISIAAILRKHQNRPAVISRGYGRRDESAVLVVSDGKRVLADARAGGDEPVLIGSKLAGVPVVVGADRFQAASFAHKNFANDTVVLDDGFQHLRLHRDLDIVLVDAADPFGSGKLFPAGILREPLGGLRRAGVVLVTNADRAGDPDLIKKTIRRYTSAPIFTSRPAPTDLIEITTGIVKPLDTLRGSKVLAFAGIARPSTFFSLLGSLGSDIKAQVGYADHYPYKKSDLAGIFQKRVDERIDMIVTTEKDAARLKELNPEGIWALRIELKVVENEEWEAVLLNHG